MDKDEDYMIEELESGYVAMGWSPIASQRIDVTLNPGEGKSFVFILGYVENEDSEEFSEEELQRKREGKLLSSQNSDVTLINKTKARELIGWKRFKHAKI